MTKLTRPITRELALTERGVPVAAKIDPSGVVMWPKGTRESRELVAITWSALYRLLQHREERARRAQPWPW